MSAEDDELLWGAKGLCGTEEVTLSGSEDSEALSSCSLSGGEGSFEVLHLLSFFFLLLCSGSLLISIKEVDLIRSWGCSVAIVLLIATPKGGPVKEIALKEQSYKWVDSYVSAVSVQEQ